LTIFNSYEDQRFDEVTMSVRLFVGNLPYDATEEEIRHHFSTVGDLSYVSIPLDRETGKKRGFAFVEFADERQAQEAIRQFNNQPFKGRPLAVTRHGPKNPARDPWVAAVSDRPVPDRRVLQCGRRLPTSPRPAPSSAIVLLAETLVQIPNQRATGHSDSDLKAARRH